LVCTRSFTEGTRKEIQKSLQSNI